MTSDRNLDEADQVLAALVCSCMRSAAPGRIKRVLFRCMSAGNRVKIEG